MCRSFLYISQDSIVGVGQRNGNFWERIARHYSVYKPEGSRERPARSLESKWGCIKHDVSKFIGVYQQVKDADISGTLEEDLRIRALDLYVHKHPNKKKFIYLECWLILKECPRWADVREEVRRSSTMPRRA